MIGLVLDRHMTVRRTVVAERHTTEQDSFAGETAHTAEVHRRMIAADRRTNEADFHKTEVVLKMPVVDRRMIVADRRTNASAEAESPIPAHHERAALRTNT
jgi:hypothetical protein